MSVHVFFMFSTGLAKPMLVPKGTLRALQHHVQHVTETLGLKVTKYQDNPAHWETTTPEEHVPDKVVCETAKRHNRWVRWLYEMFSEWGKATMDTPPSGAWVRDSFDRAGGFYFQSMPAIQEPPDTLTPEDAQTFWHGLQEIEVPPRRWTSDYYRDRMEHIYEVMRGRPSEGVSLDAKPLTPAQAGAVIRLFESWIDPSDMRLEVPDGEDQLYSTNEYEWCSKCGAVPQDEAPSDEGRGCWKKKRKCPLVKELCG